MTNDEDVDLREVQTAKLRRMNSVALVAATRAIRETGIEKGSFRFDVEAADDLGMVPAFGTEEEITGRDEDLARKIYRVNNGGTLRLGIPDAALEAIGIDPEEIDWDDPPELAVWAGDGVLAFERAGSRTVTLGTEGDLE